MNSMSDLLSASSLLLAILTTLYSLFYSSINEFIGIKPSLHKADNKKDYESGKEIRNTKILPILLSSIILSAVFIPEAVNIIYESFRLIKLHGFDGVYYDTVKTTYIVVTLFIIALSFSIVLLTFKFFKQLNNLK